MNVDYCGGGVEETNISVDSVNASRREPEAACLQTAPLEQKNDGGMGREMTAPWQQGNDGAMVTEK